MSAKFKLLLDENIGKPIGSVMATLLNFHPDPPEIGFVVDRFGGEKDLVWVPKIAAEGWVVLSTDRSKQCGGSKLHHVCEEHKVTHILMSKALHDMKQFYKVATILTLWDELVTTISQATPGCRFNLKLERGSPVILLHQRQTRQPQNVTQMSLDEQKSQKIQRAS